MTVGEIDAQNLPALLWKRDRVKANPSAVVQEYNDLVSDMRGSAARDLWRGWEAEWGRMRYAPT